MTTIETIAEAYVFAEKSGLGTGHMASLIDTMFPQPPHTVYSRKMTNGEYYTGEVRTAHIRCSQLGPLLMEYPIVNCRSSEGKSPYFPDSWARFRIRDVAKVVQGGHRAFSDC